MRRGVFPARASPRMGRWIIARIRIQEHPIAREPNSLAAIITRVVSARTIGPSARSHFFAADRKLPKFPVSALPTA